MRNTTIKRLFGAAFLGLALVSTSEASILFTSGDVFERNTPPSSVLIGEFEHNNRARIFFETTQKLTSRQMVDIMFDGVYSDNTDFPQGFIPRNTNVSSYYLMSDPLDNGPKNYSGSVTFTTAILGIIVNGNRLNNTQYLAAPGTAYPTEGRSAELNGNSDVIAYFSGANTVFIDWRTSGSQDAIRILTAVPEPGTTALLGLGFAGIAALRLRRRR